MNYATYPGKFRKVILGTKLDENFSPSQKLVDLKAEWGDFELEKEKVDETIKQYVEDRIKEVSNNNLNKMDMFIITPFGALFSLFFLIWGAIISDFLLMFTGTLVLVITTFHVIDGVKRRWAYGR